MTDTLVIFLHGVGSRGADISGLARVWEARLPDTAFAAPDGPQAFDQGGAGRQWFSVSGVNKANRAERIVAARYEFDRVLEEIVTANGMNDRLDRVALVGFSQGSIMALDGVVSGRWPVGGVLALSGRLASPAPFAFPAPQTPLLMINGTVDPIMPIEEARLAEERLVNAGYNAELAVIDGLGHTVTREAADIGGVFLANLFGQKG
ncbi:dienelactone hydrolase family protein [Novosphingobium profundi]|uniref:alpha/beta hydrolase n=1 Tax=Novosphingobium profundi TaxID=1774954 RepID=UPI001BD98A84|nr:dienelactone hydrolase family protein [Novosphingobium profundi]MBT0667293.1 dienelactone hydrolase family protein [Novosphingobium profundi]